MEDLDLIQGSPEWLSARCGSLGASQLGDALARTKTGFGASRANLCAQLVVERMTGRPTETYCNDAMRRGLEKEPDARIAYEMAKNVDVQQVGLRRHPKIAGTHASPDGLVGGDGLVEIKAPSSATHLDNLLGASVPQKYALQCQWQMIVFDRAWTDLISFDDRFPGEMALFITRIDRLPMAEVDKLESDVREFLGEVAAKVEALEARFRREAA